MALAAGALFILVCLYQVNEERIGKMSGKPIVILLVEDNEDHAELVKRNLEEQEINHNIYHVADGEAALDFLFHRGAYENEMDAPRPQLILLDLRLPKIDGLSVLKEIKACEDLKVIPTIILTSSESDADIFSAYSNYANSFLVKPMDFQDYTKLMQELGLYWLICNTSPQNKGV